MTQMISNKITKSYIETGKKWKFMDTIRNAKVNLTFKEIIGQTQTGRQGSGMNGKQWWSKTTDKNCHLGCKERGGQ